jgi:(1->4)-alpha-D-glucan 1-alpha-D-glucosylmutase
MNGLAQVALRCTSPGVPDCYQGTELWDLSLVDPDNRRKVDYDARTASLAQAASAIDLLQTWCDGRVKQALLFELLNVRKSTPELFARGAYVPLTVYGPRAENVAAFIRSMGDRFALIAVPLRCAQHCIDVPLPDPAFWGDTTIALPEIYRRRWQHIFDGSRLDDPALACGALFARFPVAVLI